MGPYFEKYCRKSSGVILSGKRATKIFRAYSGSCALVYKNNNDN